MRTIKVIHNGVEKTMVVRTRGLGDVIATALNPIARIMGLPCIDPKTKQIRPESGCGKRKTWLNKL